MTRTAFPFVAKDISGLARSLGRDLAAAERPPGHLQLMNMLARGAGFRNFQHFRAQAAAEDRLDRPVVPEPVDHLKVERAARLFDAEGCLLRWPSKAGLREPCLWVLWSALPAGRSLTEKEVNALLSVRHRFGDAALLRRELADRGMVTRNPDGSNYRRVERRPPPEALDLIRRLKRP